MRSGSNWYLQITAGQMNRKAFGIKGKGMFGILAIGKKLNSFIQISVPMYFREMHEGLGRRWKLDIQPLFGVYLDV